MKLLVRFLVLTVLLVGFFLHAQGRAKLNKMGRKEVVKIISSLKLEMTVAETMKYLSSRGLEPDWTAYESRPEKTNSFDIWYLYNSFDQPENVRVTFHAKRPVSVEQWKVQYPTNSSLVSAHLVLGNSWISISFTNAP